MKIIGISGFSASGKSTAASWIKANYSEKLLSYLPIDFYYHPTSKLEKDPHGYFNFDSINALDFEKINNHMEALENGESVFMREYTFNNKYVVPETFTINPAPFLLIDGHLWPFFAPIAKRVSTHLHIHADEEIRWKRRLQRDKVDRGISQQEIEHQWKHHVIPLEQNLKNVSHSTIDRTVANNGKKFPIIELKKMMDSILF